MFGEQRPRRPQGEIEEAVQATASAAGRWRNKQPAGGRFVPGDEIRDGQRLAMAGRYSARIRYDPILFRVDVCLWYSFPRAPLSLSRPQALTCHQLSLAHVRKKTNSTT